MVKDQVRIAASYADVFSWYIQCVQATKYAKENMEHYRKMLLEAGGADEIERIENG